MRSVLAGILVCLLLSAAPACFADTDSLTFQLVPSLGIPLGESASLYTLGFGLDAVADYKLPFFPLLSARGEAGYRHLPIQTKDAVSTFLGGGGIGVNVPLGGKFSFCAHATAGYYYGIITEPGGYAGGNAYVAAGASLDYALLPTLSLQAGLGWMKGLSLFDGLGVTLGTVYHASRQRAIAAEKLRLLAPPPNPLKSDRIELRSVFPVLFKYYDTHPVGKIRLRNSEKDPVSDLSVSFFVERYMDSPKQCATVPLLGPGVEQEVDLLALFSDRVLEITEGTMVSAKVICSFRYKGGQYSQEFTESLRLYNRNALTWDDDRKAAAFVTAKDPAIMTFSKRIASWVNEKPIRGMGENVRFAMAFFEALRLAGLSYVKDPSTPFTTYSQDALLIDYLQFPRQTMAFAAGDCDDLSILFAGLLEAVGVETAFITVPGHIFMAFSAGDPVVTAGPPSLDEANYFKREAKLWIPVEVTKVKDGFLAAWAEGARQWKEYATGGEVRFYPVHRCWELFEPVGLPGASEEERFIPPKADVLAAVDREVARFIARELGPQVNMLEAMIKKSPGDAKLLNSLGVLYAKFGQADKASQKFRDAIGKGEYLPPLLNLGNLAFQDRNLGKALEYYSRAQKLQPNNAAVLLGLARTYGEMQNFDLSLSNYEKLKQVDAGLAQRFAYLEMKTDATDRASLAGQMREVMIWGE
jgi:hypothetical protein